jgi:hypothetical protein
MKPKTFVAIFATIIFALCCTNSVAQSCNFTIDNATSCTIVGTVNYYDNSVPGCTNVCYTTAFTVLPNNTKSVVCSGCTGVCNVEVIVSSPVSLTVDINNQTDSAPGCVVNVNAQWNTNNVDITP